MCIDTKKLVGRVVCVCNVCMFHALNQTADADKPTLCAQLLMRLHIVELEETAF